jgi:hypothetical protein
MAVMSLQLNTPVEITRDLQVEVTDLVTNRIMTTTANLDGTVNLRNLNPGEHRVRVIHPNLSFPVLDQPVRVLTRIPTLVPIKIDLSIFENTPVRDIAEADLAPVQQSLAAAQDGAGKQNAKQGGEPIYAEDWNALADTLGDVADATLELTRRVSPTGHDHPELIEKMNEIQRNLERFLDVFGRSMAQVQRQLEQLALQMRADQALDRIPDLPPALRAEVTGIVSSLDDVRIDNPYVYTSRFKRVGEELEAKVVELLAAAPPEVESEPEIEELFSAARTMSATKPAFSFEDEVMQHLKVDQIGGGNIGKVIGSSVGR